MKKIDWGKVQNFVPAEFSQDPNLAEPELIYTLDRVRSDYDRKVRLSPVNGAFARFGGSKTSQHYVGESENDIVRKTTAIDVFPEGIPIYFYSCILGHTGINGIGIYLHTTGIDGQPWIMFHIDLRKVGASPRVPLIWIAEKVLNPKTARIVTAYRYPQRNSEYWRLLQDDRLYEDRIKSY